MHRRGEPCLDLRSCMDSCSGVQPMSLQFVRMHGVRTQDRASSRYVSRVSTSDPGMIHVPAVRENACFWERRTVHLRGIPCLDLRSS